MIEATLVETVLNFEFESKQETESKRIKEKKKPNKKGGAVGLKSLRRLYKEDEMTYEKQERV